MVVDDLAATAESVAAGLQLMYMQNYTSDTNRTRKTKETTSMANANKIILRNPYAETKETRYSKVKWEWSARRQVKCRYVRGRKTGKQHQLHKVISQIQNKRNGKDNNPAE